MKLATLVGILLLCLSPATLAQTLSVLRLEVKNMTCAACPITVRKALERLPGVKSAKVDYASATAVVEYDPARIAPDMLTKATADAGFPSRPRTGE